MVIFLLYRVSLLAHLLVQLAVGFDRVHLIIELTGDDFNLFKLVTTLLDDELVGHKVFEAVLEQLACLGALHSALGQLNQIDEVGFDFVFDAGF